MCRSHCVAPSTGMSMVGQTQPGIATRVVVAVVLTAAGACDSSGPPLVSLSGTVSVNGHPLPRGMIQFESESAGGRTAVAAIVDGRFTAETSGRLGIVPGRYRARIDARAESKDETDTFPKPLIAPKYAVAATSGLTCEAVKGSENAVEWKLEPPK